MPGAGVAAGAPQADNSSSTNRTLKPMALRKVFIFFSFDFLIADFQIYKPFTIWLRISYMRATMKKLKWIRKTSQRRPADLQLFTLGHKTSSS
jgi:hypothetical protein